MEVDGGLKVFQDSGDWRCEEVSLGTVESGPFMVCGGGAVSSDVALLIPGAFLQRPVVVCVGPHMYDGDVAYAAGVL